MDAVDVDFFKQALKEEGLTGVDVMTYRDDRSMSQVIRIEKRVNGQIFGQDVSITDHEIDQIGNLKQHLGMLAREVAQSFKSHTTEQHEWGENRVRLDLHEDYEATCYRCGAEVSMNGLEQGSVRMSETAVPQARTGGYKSLPTPKLRMTLLALLKEECEPYCPNSPNQGLVNY